MTEGLVRAILFDWDGILVDTAEASYRCYVRMFESFGITFDRGVYARTYSPNWYHTFRSVGLAEEHWPEADARWFSHFAEERVELIDGARETLTFLSERRVAAAIVTSGSRERVTREIADHRLSSHLSDCVFGSDVANRKSHPEALMLCLSLIIRRRNKQSCDIHRP